MSRQKEMTAFCSSVGADERQPLNVCTNHSITADYEKINPFVLKGGGTNG